MKCPKCAYLGFDTGERCKNCGYDFSLMTSPSQDPVGELALRSQADDLPAPAWLGDIDTGHGDASRAASAVSQLASAGTSAAAAAALNFEPPVPPPSFRGEPSLPLFGTSPGGDDEPLIKVPAQPRAPLAVRRTPETPRLRAVAKSVSRPAPEPQLDFVEEPAAAVSPTVHRDSRSLPEHLQTCGAGARILAAAIDHAILLSIDIVVIYLTLRIVSLTMSDWRALPVLPMGTFLGLLKLAYFTAFTSMGGQTIGKMAAGIRVVSDDLRPIDAPHAIHRTLAGAVSFLTLGAGFIPALFGTDRRALHDRLAHTRVVIVPGV